MATPWKSGTVKDIHRIGHGYQPLSAAKSLPAFSAPTPKTSLSFSAARLQGSMAIAMVLSHAGAARSASVAAHVADLLTEFVDDLPPADLELVADVQVLSDVGRSFLSSLFGAAVADQYMLAMGYRYRCNAREVIGAGVAGDYLYDGISATSSHVVMAEAKGSIVSSGRKITIATTVRRAYRRQVEPHVGLTYPIHGGSIFVIHGYCIGAGAAAGGGAALAHVEETGAPVTTGTGKAGSTPAAPSSYRNRAAALAIGLRNYAAVFELLNSGESAEALRQFMASGKGVDVLEEEFSVISYRDSEFVASRADRANFGYALWKPIFDQVRELAKGNQGGDVDAFFPIPPEQVTLDHEDGGAVLPDGLAVLPKDMRMNPGGRTTNRPRYEELVKAYDYAARVPVYR